MTDTPLMDVMLGALAGIAFSILVGTAVNDYLGITYHEPRWFQHVVYDSEFEKHVQLVEFEVEE